MPGFLYLVWGRGYTAHARPELMGGRKIHEMGCTGFGVRGGVAGSIHIACGDAALLRGLDRTQGRRIACKFETCGPVIPRMGDAVERLCATKPAWISSFYATSVWAAFLLVALVLMVIPIWATRIRSNS